MADSEDSKAGYKRPPKDTQYQPGQSGNPRGRPPGTPSTAKLLESLLREELRVKVRGKKRTMTVFEAMFFRALAKATSGDPAARRNVMRLMELAGMVDVIPAPESDEPWGVMVIPDSDVEAVRQGEPIGGPSPDASPEDNHGDREDSR